MIGVIGEEVTSTTNLLIAGLISGSGVVALVVKFLIASPERETKAYKQGGLDEKNRSEEEIKQLKLQIITQYAEIASLRVGLLRLAIATELTPEQRKEIADILGFKSATRLKSESKKQLGEDDE